MNLEKLNKYRVRSGLWDLEDIEDHELLLSILTEIK